MQTDRTLQKQIRQYSHRPRMQNQCLCCMCRKFKQNKISVFLKQKQLHGIKVLQDLHNGIRKKTHLKWILKRLCLPPNKIVLGGINVFIPQICFYQDGQLSALYINKDIFDPSLKQINKERLNPTMFQKAINERRWKYRQKVQNKKGVIGKIDTKEAIVIQFNDGFQKLISQNQFSLIMQRRRQDPFWSTVSSFKNFIPTRKQKQQGTGIKYVQNQNIDKQLFLRAQTISQINATQILQTYDNYISQEEQQDFCKKLIEAGDQLRIFTYMTYKIITFISQFHDVKIIKGYFQWALDELKRPLLMDVTRLNFQELIKYDWTNQVIQRKQRQNEYNTFYSKIIPPLNPQSLQCSIKVQNQMKSTFQDLKQYYGLSLKQEEDVEQTKNQEYFKKVYPKFSVDLQQIKSMDIPTFKSRYLGDRNQRKPIVKQFKPSMIRVLHSLTPSKKNRDRCQSAIKASTTMVRPTSYKNASTRLNSGRSTINTSWYHSFYNQHKSGNMLQF